MAKNQSSADKRKMQNKGVKAGTVRLGAKGKYMRKYNATTGKWERVSGNVTKAVAAGKSRGYKPMTQRTSSAPSSLTKPDNKTKTSGPSAASIKASANRAKAAGAQSRKNSIPGNGSPAARIRNAVANMRINTKQDKKAQQAFLNAYGTTSGGKRIK